MENTEEYYLRLFRVTPGCNLLLHPDGKEFIIDDISNDFVKVLKYPPEQIRGKSLRNLLNVSIDNEVFNGKILACISADMPVMFENVSLHDDYAKSKEVSAICRFIPVSKTSNTIICNLTLQNRITSDAAFLTLIEQTPIAIDILKGTDLVFEAANSSMLKLLGRKREEVIGKKLLDAFPEAAGQGFDELLLNTMKTGERFSAEEHPVTLNFNGVPETVYVNFIYEPLREDDGSITGVICVSVDVTPQVLARRKAEEAGVIAEKQKRLYETITANTPDLIYVFGLDYRFIYANEALLEMWGKSREEAIGRLLIENGYEQWHADMHEREIDHVVKTRESVRGEVSFPHAVLGKRIYDYILVPVLNEKGEVEAVAGTTRDISEIKQAEATLRESEAELQQKVADRTAELQQVVNELRFTNQNLQEFAYAASHDLKEPIRKIHLFTDKLKTQLSETLNDEQQLLFDKLTNASNRMSNLIEDLLAYSQTSRGAGFQARVDLNDCVSQVLEDLEIETQQANAAITVAPLPVINGNVRQLQQLFHNLLTNAIKYREEGRPCEISIAYEKVDGIQWKQHVTPNDTEKEFHKICVNDNGIGFPQNESQRIFNVFTRLHGNSVYRGTGVGLSIVQKVVQNHNGYIWAESTQGKGSEFTVLIPVD